MKMTTSIFAAGLAAISASAVELPHISAKDGFRELVYGMRCRATRTAENTIEITGIEDDCGVHFRVKPFFANQVDRIEITYRAQGTRGKGGEFFYADTMANLTQEQMLYFPAMITDGKWHTVTLTPDNDFRKGKWANTGIIGHFRWDPINHAGGKVELKEIKFLNSRDVKTAAQAVADAEFAKKWEQDKWPDVVSEIPLTNAAVWVQQANSVKVKPKVVHHVKSFGGSAQPMRVKAGETAKFRFDFSGMKPEEEFDVNVQFLEGSDSAWTEKIHISGLMAQAISEKRWRLQFDVTMPKYYNTRRLKAMLWSDALHIIDGVMPEAPFTLVRNDEAMKCYKPITSSVKMIAGVPQFLKNGEPFYALWAVGRGNGGIAAGNPLDIPHHSNAPFDLNTLWPAPRAIWPRMGEFKSIVYDRFVEELTKQFGPDCMFMVEIPLTPPPDWRTANPDEMCQHEDGTINTDCGDNFINYSFASKKARAAMMEVLEQALDYLEKAPYANRIYGYRIASGHTYEWLGWDAKPREKLLDFSPVAKRGFEEYMAKHYPDIKDRSIPGKAERFARDNGNLFADLAKNPRCKAYYDFYCEALVDTMMAICGRAKQKLGGKKVVGTYYGYVTTLFDGGNQMRAHYALEKVLSSGTVDFLMSPQPYRVRQLGGTQGDMKPFASMQNHAIIPALEDDTRGHLHIENGYTQNPTEELSIGMMRRNMGFALCRWQPFYALAMNYGLNFDYPVFGYDAAAIKSAGDFTINGKAPRHAEIALVTSEEAIKAMPRYNGEYDKYKEMYQTYKPNAGGKVERHEVGHGIPVLTENYNRIFNRVCRLGAPVDYLLAEDLAAAHPYKLYIFLNCSYEDPKFVADVAKLREQNCVLLWSHAPGYMGANGRSTENMRKLTGVDLIEIEGAFDPATKLVSGEIVGATGNKSNGPFFSMLRPDETLGSYVANGRAALTLKKTGKATTVHSGSYRLEMPVLREMAKRAGVWSFTDNDDPVEANDAFVALHARYAGKKVIRLPKKCDVVDVFNRKIVARDADRFEFDSPLHASWLFYYGNEADALLEKLNY